MLKKGLQIMPAERRQAFAQGRTIGEIDRLRDRVPDAALGASFGVSFGGCSAILWVILDGMLTLQGDHVDPAGSG